MNRYLKKVVSTFAVALAVCTAGMGMQAPAYAAETAGTGSEASVQTQFNGPNGKFRVYLSPSAQPWNPYVDGSGSEELHMRQVAMAMVPYLKSYGIDYVIGAAQTGSSANQKNTLQARANEAKNSGCDLYLAIHSNAWNGKTRGTKIYYNTNRSESKRIASVIQANFPYPDKNNISLAYNNSLMEMYMPTMPNVLVETAFHDNYDDVAWIHNNIDAMAQGLAKSVRDYAAGSAGASTSTTTGGGISLDRIMVDIPAGTGIVLTASNIDTGSNYGYGQIAWTSSNPAVATVDDYGTIIAKAPGVATIYAKAGNLSASCAVNVTTWQQYQDSIQSVNDLPSAPDGSITATEEG